MASAAQTIRRKRVLRAPGYASPSLELRGAAISYLVAMIVVPVAAIIAKEFADRLDSSEPRWRAPVPWEAIRLTLVTSALAAIINAIFGTMLAYILVRYRFRARGCCRPS